MLGVCNKDFPLRKDPAALAVCRALCGKLAEFVPRPIGAGSRNDLLGSCSVFSNDSATVLRQYLLLRIVFLQLQAVPLLLSNKQPQ